MATASRVPFGIGSKIVAVGRNYADHAAELGNAVPSEPFVFIKPLSSVIFQGSSVQIPKGIGSVHHEVELGCVIGKTLTRVSETEALDGVSGYVLALDMTARDLQAAAKEKRLPWTMAKCRDTFTPLGDVIPKTAIPDPQDVELWLKVDGDDRQRGSTSHMIFNIPSLLSWISQGITLNEGDVVLTGTPAGVGPVLPGQVMTCGITGLDADMAFPCVELGE